MTSTDYDRITDELLSAYIDDQVTEHERNMVEAAIAVDNEVAWRLNTLQQTVRLLRSLPEFTLPRSFALTEAQVAEAPNTFSAPSVDDETSETSRLAAAWRSFWHPGSAVYRNMATASFALLVVLIGLNGWFDLSTSLPLGATTELARMEQPVAAPVDAPAAVTVDTTASTQAMESEQAMESTQAVEPNAAAMDDEQTVNMPDAEAAPTAPDAEIAIAEDAADTAADTETEPETDIEPQTEAEIEAAEELAVVESAALESAAIDSTEMEPAAGDPEAVEQQAETAEEAPMASAAAAPRAEDAPVEAAPMADAAAAEMADVEAAPSSPESDAFMLGRSAALTSEASRPESDVPAQPPYGRGAGPAGIGSAPGNPDAQSQPPFNEGQFNEGQFEEPPLALLYEGEEDISRSAESPEATESEEAAVAMVAPAESNAIEAGTVEDVTETPAAVGTMEPASQAESDDAEDGAIGQDSEYNTTVVAAVPETPSTHTPVRTQQSPLTYPYPPAEPSPPIFRFSAFSATQWLALGLLAMTVVFGGLWWQSRGDADSSHSNHGS